eukprot:576460_1
MSILNRQNSRITLSNIPNRCLVQVETHRHIQRVKGVIHENTEQVHVHITTDIMITDQVHVHTTTDVTADHTATNIIQKGVTDTSHYLPKHLLRLSHVQGRDLDPETTSTSNKDIETPTLQEQLREARSQAKTFAAVNRLLQEQLQQTKAELQNKHSQLQIKEQELKNARNQLNELNAKYIMDLKQQLSTSHDTSSDSDSSEATEGKRRSKRTLKKTKKKKEKPQIPKKTLFADLPASIRQRLRTNWNDGHMTFTHKETETAFDANTWHRNEALTVETLCRQFDFAAVIRFCMKHKIGVIQSRTTNSGTGLPTTKMANCVWICLNGLANAGHIQWLGSAVGGDIFKELSSKPSKPLSENEKKDAGNAMIDFMDIQLYDIPFSSANLKKPNNQDNNNNSNNNNDINPANLNPAQQTIETNQKNAET